MSRAPSNLLQWLRLREMRPVGRERLPLNLMRRISLHPMRRRSKQCIYVRIKLALGIISQEIHFGMSNFVSFLTVSRQFNDLMTMINGRRINLNYALENGLLCIFHQFVELTPFAMQTYLYVFIVMIVLRDLAFLTYRFARDEYQVEFTTYIRLLLCSPRSLMSSSDILKVVQEEFPLPMKERLIEDLCLRGIIHQQSKTFYNLFNKSKEIVHHHLKTHKTDSSYHCIIQMDGVIEKIVHEAYCTAICMESLLRQPVSTDVVHKLHFAGLKLRELLSLIFELLVYPTHCRCSDCERISQRVICAGIRRLIHVLVTILASIPEDSWHYIEVFVEDLADLIYYVCDFDSYEFDFVLWYSMYTTYDLDKMIHNCSEKWSSTLNAIEYRNVLLTVRGILRRMSPAEYILDPTFHNVPFNLNREIPPREPILTIRKLQRSRKSRFSPLLTNCFDLVEDHIDMNWPDREYWSGITDEILSMSNSEAE